MGDGKTEKTDKKERNHKMNKYRKKERKQIRNKFYPEVVRVIVSKNGSCMVDLQSKRSIL